MSSRRRSARIAGLGNEVPSPIKTTLPLKKQPLREQVASRAKPIIPTLLKRPSVQEKVPEEMSLVEENSESLEKVKTETRNPTLVHRPSAQEKVLEEVSMVQENSKSVEKVETETRNPTLLLRPTAQKKISEVVSIVQENSVKNLETEVRNPISLEDKGNTALTCNKNEKSKPEEGETTMGLKPKEVIKEPKLTKSSNENLPPVRGRCKSGRFWKSERDRFRSVIKTKGLKSNLKQRMKHKEDMRRIKAYEQSLKDRVRKEREELRERQEQNKKNREENQRKSEVVQQVNQIIGNLVKFSF